MSKTEWARLAWQLGFPRLITIDSEFRPDANLRPAVVCFCAHEWPSGRTWRVWTDGGKPKLSLPVDANTLWISYVCAAELRSMLALHHPLPKNFIDLFIENKWLHNFQESVSERHAKRSHGFYSLAGTLRREGADAIAAEEKEEWRKLILKGGPYTAAQREGILDYCMSDVDSLDRLLPLLAPRLDVPRALYRGECLVEFAKIEDRGIPIDAARLTQLHAHSEKLIRHLLAQQPQLDVYEGTSFNQKKFRTFVDGLGCERWQKTETGLLRTDREYLQRMGRIYPLVHDLAELRTIVLELQRGNLRAGADGRVRCSLWPLNSITSRNQPSTGKKEKEGIPGESPFIFSLPTMFRFLIRPQPGSALAYLDWSSQEFAIAAHMSQDREMIRAYESGNPYLALAIKLGRAPIDATKESHPDVHQKFKIIVLSISYGRGKHGLAKTLRIPIAEASALLRGFWQTFKVYGRWRTLVQTMLFGKGRLWVWDGWQCKLGVDPNLRSVYNWPIQSTGAVLLRLAVWLAGKRGVRIIATVHDGILIEADAKQIAEQTRIMAACMDTATRMVLGAQATIRVDTKIVKRGEHYYDAKGAALWTTVCKFLGWKS